MCTLNKLLLSVLTIASFCLIAAGQTVKGEVTDPNSGRIVHAKIVIEAKRFRKSVFTNNSGEYSVDVPAGKYKVKAEKNGFRTSGKKIVRVILGKENQINFVLTGIRNDSEHP